MVPLIINCSACGAKNVAPGHRCEWKHEALKLNTLATEEWADKIACQEELATLRTRNAVLEADRDVLHRAVLNQCGDNFCWLEDSVAVKALPEAEFLESCRRYRLQLVEDRGEATGLKTIAQLEAENETLRHLADAVRAYDEAFKGRRSCHHEYQEMLAAITETPHD